MKRYGYIPSSLSTVCRQDGGVCRVPNTETDTPAFARKNTCENTVKSLCMCGFILNTHTVEASRVI